MGFPVYKPPLSPSSRTPSPSPPPQRRSQYSRSRNLRAPHRRPPQLRRTESYLSPYSVPSSRTRSSRHRRNRDSRRPVEAQAQLPTSLTTTSFLASSFQINTAPNMSYISLSKPLFAAYNNISTGPGNSSSESAHPSNNQAMEVTTTTSTTNEAEDIPQEMFSIEWIYTNRELAMELLLGNFAGDESFADLLRLPANMLNDSDDSSDIYEDDEDVDMEGTSEEVTEESTERIWNGDILRGVDEDYD